MKITNKFNLPETFVNAVKKNTHVGADYSASQLTKPVRMVQLEKRYKDKLVEDVSDRIWSLFGSAVHSVLEQGETENQIVEGYLESNINGVTLSGTADLYENECINDYKVTSVWTIVYLDDKAFDFEAQLNVYAHLFREAGFVVKDLKNIFILRDWQKSKAKFDKNYPQSNVLSIQMSLWEEDKTKEFIYKQIKSYESHNKTLDNDLPLCTEKERWSKPAKYAVVKKNRKRAMRVLDTKEDAEKYLAENGGDDIEERKGELFKRCEYCSVSAFCNQFKDSTE